MSQPTLPGKAPAALPVLILLVLLLASLVGGCKVEAGSPAPDSSSAVTDAVVDDKAHLDLRKPPTREQLGVRPGADSMSYARSSGNVMIDVGVALPGGGQLHVPAIALHAAFSDIIGNEIVVNRVEPSLDAAERAVLADVDRLGLDAPRIRSVVTAWRRGERDLETANVFRGARLDYLGIEVEMRPNGPAGEVLVNYTFSWPAFADITTSATPASPTS